MPYSCNTQLPYSCNTQFTQFGVPIVEHFEFVFNSDTAEYEIDKWFEPDFPEDKTLEKWVDSLDSNKTLDTNSKHSKVCTTSTNTCSDDLSKSSSGCTYYTDSNIEQSDSSNTNTCSDDLSKSSSGCTYYTDSNIEQSDSSNMTRDKLQDTEDYISTTSYEEFMRSKLKQKKNY